MKKRFSDEQIISILREAEAGVSARELCRNTPFPMPLSTSMDYLRVASTESGFGLLLTSIRHQENLCPNG